MKDFIQLIKLFKPYKSQIRTVSLHFLLMQENLKDFYNRNSRAKKLDKIMNDNFRLINLLYLKSNSINIINK